MARLLKITPRQFLGRFCRRALGRVSLLELPNGDCIFLSPAGCRVYPVRPDQCKSFPFWNELLRSPQAWEAATARCPGVGTGRTYSREEIDAIRDGERQTE